MKIAKKLRDVTYREYSNWYKCRTCIVRMCSNCPFKDVECAPHSHRCWVSHKDLFIDKFLDQTIEVEVPDILNKEEKEYLSAVIKPFRERIKWIKKVYTYDYFFIQIATYSDWGKDGKPTAYHISHLPPFKESDKMYENMEFDEEYKLEELGL